MAANISTTMDYTLGADYSWIGPVISGVGDVVGNVVGGKKAEPPPPERPEIPWIPIMVIGGIAVLGVAAMGATRKRRRVLAS